MEKSRIINPMKMAALPNSGKEKRRVLTCFLIVELALILLSGLMTLKILRGFKFILTAIISKTLNKLVNNVTYPAMMIVKSIMFHISLKYVFSPKAKPIAPILIKASAQYI